MERKIHFIVAFLLLETSVLAQLGPKTPLPSHLSSALQAMPLNGLGLSLRPTPIFPAAGHEKPPPVISPNLPVSISADFTSSNLGFFCKQEWKIEKAISFPFRFRLGSVEQTDFLEGKRAQPH